MVQLEQHQARAENVARDSEAATNSRRRFKRLTRVRQSFHKVQSLVGIFFSVERQRWFVLREVVAVAIISFFFLPAAFAQFFQTLKESTVDEDSRFVCYDQVLRTGDSADATPKFNARQLMSPSGFSDNQTKQ